jgi:hypothetical protein
MAHFSPVSPVWGWAALAHNLSKKCKKPDFLCKISIARCYIIEGVYYMKKLGAIAMLLAIGISAVFVSCTIEIVRVKGNGHLISSERTVSPFEKINSGGSAEIRFHESQEYRAVVTVDSNLDEYVEIKTRNNTLIIGTESGRSYSFTKLVVDVYCPTLTGISISGSGSFKGEDIITASRFDTNVSGSGKIYGTVECDTFHADISGSGKINVTGTSTDSKIDISGSGDFIGTEFNVNNATVHISGSGKATVCVSDKLNANISGSGEIRYYGNPNVDSKISGSGRIKKM